MTALVLALFPERTDVNGDAQNALVLVRRAQWAGEDAELGHLALGAAYTGPRPAVVVLGSSVDSALPALRDALLPVREALVSWLDEGTQLLAVGTGMELLGSMIRVGDSPSGTGTDVGGVVEGLGLLPGSASPLAARITGDLVTDAAEGRLVGYENHARGFALDAGARPLGTVIRGVGDGRGVDGVRHAGIVGTRLHGPVLAKNPALADALLTAALGHPVTPAGDTARAADDAAAVLRERLLSAGG